MRKRTRYLIKKYAPLVAEITCEREECEKVVVVHMNDRHKTKYKIRHYPHPIYNYSHYFLVTKTFKSHRYRIGSGDNLVICGCVSDAILEIAWPMTEWLK